VYSEILGNSTSCDSKNSDGKLECSILKNYYYLDLLSEKQSDGSQRGKLVEQLKGKVVVEIKSSEVEKSSHRIGSGGFAHVFKGTYKGNVIVKINFEQIF
jgi:hypothetical protein